MWNDEDIWQDWRNHLHEMRRYDSLYDEDDDDYEDEYDDWDDEDFNSEDREFDDDYDDNYYLYSGWDSWDNDWF